MTTSNHHRSAPSLPRHWIVLPGDVLDSARSHPLLRGLVPSHVGYFPRARLNNVVRPRGTDQAIFQYCAKGRGYCEVGTRRFEVHAGELFVIPRRVRHAYGSHDTHPWSVHWFHALGEQVDPLCEQLGASAEHPIVSVGSSPALIALFEELQKTLEDDYSFPRLLYASQLLTHLVGLLIQMRNFNKTEPLSSRQRVERSIRHLRENLEQPRSVATLAAMADLSQSQYSALVRRLTGYSVRDYVTRLRIHHAAQLLATTTLSVQQIAQRVGYADPLYFSRAFRNVNGSAPSVYRAQRHEPSSGLAQR